MWKSDESKRHTHISYFTRCLFMLFNAYGFQKQAPHKFDNSWQFLTQAGWKSIFKTILCDFLIKKKTQPRSSNKLLRNKFLLFFARFPRCHDYFSYPELICFLFSPNLRFCPPLWSIIDKTRDLRYFFESVGKQISGKYFTVQHAELNSLGHGRHSTHNAWHPMTSKSSFFLRPFSRFHG